MIIVIFAMQTKINANTMNTMKPRTKTSICWGDLLCKLDVNDMLQISRNVASDMSIVRSGIYQYARRTGKKFTTSCKQGDTELTVKRIA